MKVPAPVPVLRLHVHVEPMRRLGGEIDDQTALSGPLPKRPLLGALMLRGTTGARLTLRKLDKREVYPPIKDGPRPVTLGGSDRRGLDRMQKGGGFTAPALPPYGPFLAPAHLPA